MSSLGFGIPPEPDPSGQGGTLWRVERLESARQDIYRLLEFATEHDLSIDEEVIRQAVSIARLSPAEMSEQHEEALWRIRSTLSRVARPAHASGLRLLSCLEADVPANGEPRTLRGWSGRWLLAAVLVVASVHAYAVVGARLMADARGRLLEAGALERLFGPSTGDPGAPGDAVTTPLAAGIGGPTQSLTKRPSVSSIEGTIEKSRLALEYQRDRLSAWNGIWRFAIFPAIGSWTRVSAAAPAAHDEPALAERPSKVQQARRHFRELVEKSVVPVDAESYEADVAQSTIMQYLLPMLYGALGAFVFVVRRVTDDIDRGSLRMLLRIRYRVRLLLGAVFGLTVAMLATDRSPFMNNIPFSAVILAFLAGYGIDVAFGLLDILIARIRNMSIAGTIPHGS